MGPSRDMEELEMEGAMEPQRHPEASQTAPRGSPLGFQRAGTRAAQHGPERPHGPRSKRLKTVQNCTKSPQTESSQKVPKKAPRHSPRQVADGSQPPGVPKRLEWLSGRVLRGSSTVPEGSLQKAPINGSQKAQGQDLALARVKRYFETSSVLVPGHCAFSACQKAPRLSQGKGW